VKKKRVIYICETGLYSDFAIVLRASRGKKNKSCKIVYPDEGITRKVVNNSITLIADVVGLNLRVIATTLTYLRYSLREKKDYLNDQIDDLEDINKQTAVFGPRWDILLNIRNPRSLRISFFSFFRTISTMYKWIGVKKRLIDFTVATRTSQNSID